MAPILPKSSTAFLFAACGIAVTNTLHTTNAAAAFLPSSSSTIGRRDTHRHQQQHPVPVAPFLHDVPSVSSSVSQRKFALFASSTQLPDIVSMRVGELKKELESYGISTKSFLEKTELVNALEKARADGLQPKQSTTTATPTAATPTPSPAKTPSPSPPDSGVPREQQIVNELIKMQDMKAGDMKKELENDWGVSTKSFFEKSEFAKALAEARVDGVKKQQSDDEAVAVDVEVLPAGDPGPRKKQGQQQRQQGGPGGANPFGDVAGGGTGMGGMGGIADMLKNMQGGGGGGTPGGMGGMEDILKNMGGMGGGGGMPGGMGGMADMLKNMGGMGGGGGMPGGMPDMAKMQEMMSNPKVREILAKAQKNPKFMAAIQEVMSNPMAMAKYQNDPEIKELLEELRPFIS
mmetsp:Transcript_46940/g.69469  ORF Transcript_46940/g.69469 Transcript_46940/m.69469 type:complete len:405 (-) Transcript_46940:383-1597(-)|eukprot:CAMPEP_0195528124 /NCGR_PEP_ID=MMETSP0794_2-20130614/30135_1 /TAXON_ID=515487 /ORGANISM="Stephanopyxis turris, Strain CCMP 815" /LENGTH=404 /DNA_ID=CAMNT_0040659197 /DNA_START=171 /DNA_END=1385 /DNA_ORIENTATION=-